MVLSYIFITVHIQTSREWAGEGVLPHVRPKFIWPNAENLPFFDVML